jgi:hypothetical protein
MIDNNQVKEALRHKIEQIISDITPKN